MYKDVFDKVLCTCACGINVVVTALVIHEDPRVEYSLTCECVV